MRKIKLLAPIIGVTTIATTIVPMTSCTKKTEVVKDITKTEWKAAVAKICDVDNTERNYTIESVLKIGAWQDLSKNYVWYESSSMSKGLNNEVVTKIGATVEDVRIPLSWEKAYSYTKGVGLVNWQLETEYVEQVSQETYTAKMMSPYLLKRDSDIEFNWARLYKLYGLLYGWYDASVFDSNTKEYKIQMMEFDNLKLSLVLKFDTNKNISNLNWDGYLKAYDDEQYHISFESSFGKYGTTNINLDTTKAETAINNIYPANRNIQMTGADILDKNVGNWNDNDIVDIKLAPQATNEPYVYKVITFDCKLDNWSGDTNIIVLNDKILTRDIDYTVENSESANGSSKITFAEGFKSTDTLLMRLDPYTWKENVKMNVVKGA